MISNRKIYKRESFTNSRIYPSDPTGSLDDFYFRGLEND